MARARARHDAGAAEALRLRRGANRRAPRAPGRHAAEPHSGRGGRAGARRGASFAAWNHLVKRTLSSSHSQRSGSALSRAAMNERATMIEGRCVSWTKCVVVPLHLQSFCSWGQAMSIPGFPLYTSNRSAPATSHVLN